MRRHVGFFGAGMAAVLLLFALELRSEPRERKLPMALGDFLGTTFMDQINNFPGVRRIALATFPANDFEPGKGNSLLVFERGSEGAFYPVYKKAYPMKVAARPYQGRHTAHRKVFLRSPVGVFRMHKGSRNGSRYVSWTAATAKRMRSADFVPSFGLKVPQSRKPQRHFHYAVHTVPVGTTESVLRRKQFSSLGCFSLLVADMRELYEQLKPLPSSERLFVSVYDTISLDPSAEVAYLYKDLYGEGTLSWALFLEELGKHGLDPNSFDRVRVELALAEAQASGLFVRKAFASLR